MRATHSFTARAEDAGLRLDRYLAAQLPELSRTRIAELIAEGRARVNGRTAKPSHRVAAGERIEVEAAPRPAPAAVPEQIPLDILYEDGDLVVVNKPAGMTVHAGAGHAQGTLVNALLHRYRSLSAAGGALRPGIVHRLDKDTSGAIVIARNDAAHRALADLFRARRVLKMYVALVHGELRGEAGRIELPIARDPVRRVRMSARRRHAAGFEREARTDWRVLARVARCTLVAARIHTGRTHQIRAHFAALRHPVAGDELYGAPRSIVIESRTAAKSRAARVTLPAPPRNFLHAARIRFEHPFGGGRLIDVTAPLAPELVAYLGGLARAAGEDAAPLLAAVDAAALGSLEF